MQRNMGTCPVRCPCSNNTLNVWFSFLLSQSSITFAWWRNKKHVKTIIAYLGLSEKITCLKMLMSIDKHIFRGATLLANKAIYIYLLCDSKIRKGTPREQANHGSLLKKIPANWRFLLGLTENRGFSSILFI